MRADIHKTSHVDSMQLSSLLLLHQRERLEWNRLCIRYVWSGVSKAPVYKCMAMIYVIVYIVMMIYMQPWKGYITISYIHILISLCTVLVTPIRVYTILVCI